MCDTDKIISELNREIDHLKCKRDFYRYAREFDKRAGAITNKHSSRGVILK